MSRVLILKMTYAQPSGAAMRRREFISLIAGATAWPLMARSKQMPVIAFLSPVPAAEAISHLIAAFRQGLAEAGFHEGENVAIDYRFTNFKPELMQQAAGDVVRRNVNVIYVHTPEGGAAARSATTAFRSLAEIWRAIPLPWDMSRASRALAVISRGYFLIFRS